jgi:hypothetical protein
VGGEIVPTPWRGRFWDYRERGGMLVPLDGEVAWLLPGSEKPYWHGHIAEISYRFARRTRGQTVEVRKMEQLVCWSVFCLLVLLLCLIRSHAGWVFVGLFFLLKAVNVCAAERLVDREFRRP